MGRPRIVDDETLLTLIDQYYSEFCADGGRAISLPELAKHVAEHGYPDYKVTTLRRNQLARQHIEKLQQNSKEAKRAALVAYKTLDIKDFLDRHQSRASLMEALAARDQYYRTIANNAVLFNEEHRAIIGEKASLEEQLESTKAELRRIKSDCERLKAENQASQKTIRDLRSIIETYVRADIAKSILAREGIIPSYDGIVQEDVIKSTMISLSTDVHSLGAEKIIDIPSASMTDKSEDDSSDIMKHMFDVFR